VDKKFIWIGAGVVVAFVLLMVILFVGCDKKGGQIDNSVATLTLWTTEDEKSAFDQMITNFQQKYPNVKIEYVVKSEDDFLTASLNEIAAGRGPDIWAIPNDWLPQYSDKLVAIKDEIFADKKAHKTGLEVYRSQFPAVVGQDTIIGDKIYGIPVSLDTLKIFYNSQLFSDAAVDYYRTHKSSETEDYIKKAMGGTINNWDEFVTAVRLVTKKSGSTIERSAVALGTADNIPQAPDILSALMLQNGAKMVSDDLSIAQFHTEQNVFGDIAYPGTKALDFYASFADPKSENYTWNSTMPDARRAFAEGKTAMLIDYQSAADEIKRISPKLNYSIKDLPQIKETANPINFAEYPVFTVTKASQHSDIAWDFILNLTTNNSSLNTYRSITKKETVYKSQKPSFINARGWYKPDPAQTDEIFRNMVKQVSEGKNSQTAIEGAASQITTLLQQLKNR